MKFGRYTRIPADGAPSSIDGTYTYIDSGTASITLGQLPRGRRKGKAELKARNAAIAALPQKAYSKPDPTRRITTLKYDDADPDARSVTFKIEDAISQ